MKKLELLGEELIINGRTVERFLIESYNKSEHAQQQRRILRKKTN